MLHFQSHCTHWRGLDTISSLCSGRFSLKNAYIFSKLLELGSQTTKALSEVEEDDAAVVNSSGVFKNCHDHLHRRRTQH